MKLKRVLLCIALLVCLLTLPVYADTAKGEPNITPETTMKEIRENPSIQGSGISTYIHVWERDCEKLSTSKDNWTLEYAVGSESVESCAAGLNYIIETYNAGTQVTYKLYTEEEIKAEKSRDHVELYYFPADRPNARYAVVLSGNALIYDGEFRGGASTAWELHQKGYAVFSLRYRIGWEASDNAPLEDLARAIRLITDNAEKFGVRTDGYALIGYSSGGQIAGVFANADVGYGKYGVPKPGVLLMGYPINNFNEAKPVYNILLDGGTGFNHYYDYNISDCVTLDYPPTYFWYGDDDNVLKLFNYWKQGPALKKALEKNGVPYQVHVYKSVPHGTGVAAGTDADGWLNEAVALWEAHKGE